MGSFEFFYQSDFTETFCQFVVIRRDQNVLSSLVHFYCLLMKGKLALLQRC